MVPENQSSAGRIQGDLANLGHEIARRTVANILKQNRIEPSPGRESHDDLPWSLAGGLLIHQKGSVTSTPVICLRVFEGLRVCLRII